METKDIFKWVFIAFVVFVLFNVMMTILHIGQAVIIFGLFKSFIATMGAM